MSKRRNGKHAGDYKPEIADTIVMFIEAGAYEHIAAEAAGLSRDVYRQWLAKGEAKRPIEPFRAFAKRVQQAKAVARVWAEIHMHNKDVRTWLKCGPGKERPADPGWSKEVSACIEDQRQVDVLASPEWQKHWAKVLRALAPFPEARQALARLLSQGSP